ncbi:MAG: pyrH [Gammaproteobacteria bacterium]|jgi:uridylate kinase|nr:pyrH [Gammaproteobacteria bacterium]
MIYSQNLTEKSVSTGQQQSVYQRVLIKLSGEALQGDAKFGIDPAVLARLASEIRELRELNIQVAIVIGGGNLFRGATLSAAGIDRITADQMGMLATVMNALALRDALENASLSCRIMSAVGIGSIVALYERRKAIHHLENGRVVIFAAGTGNPLVTTDSAASLRAIEIEAEVLLKATNVDGIYSADPVKFPDAHKYEHLTYSEVLDKELGVMDLAAFCQCRDHNMKLRVFNINRPGVLLRIVSGASEGTEVSNEEMNQ